MQLFPIIVALKGEKTTVEYVSSNQVVGGSNLSGRAIISTTYSAFKIATSNKNKSIKVVISGWGPPQEVFALVVGHLMCCDNA